MKGTKPSAVGILRVGVLLFLTQNYGAFAVQGTASGQVFLSELTGGTRGSLYLPFRLCCEAIALEHERGDDSLWKGASLIFKLSVDYQ